MFKTEVTRTGVRAVGASVTVTATGWVREGESRHFPRAVDDTVTGIASELRFPPGFVRATRLNDEGAYALSADGDGVDLPRGEYLVRADGPVVVYVHFAGSARLRRSSEAPLLSFDEPTEVTFGLRSRDGEPPGTVTVPRTPEGVATALSAMPAGHRTVTPDRTFPRMRGPPPLVSFGDETVVPDGVTRYLRSSGVEFLFPADLSYLFPVAPLSHYLGATVRVEPDASPRLRTSAGVRELAPLPEFQSEVASLLRRTFLLDCLVRTAATDGPAPAESTHLEALSLDAESLYGRDVADRLDAYLDAPFERISGDLPEWHLSMYIDPTFEHVRTLPRVLSTLPNVFLPKAEPLRTEELLKRSLDDFYRGIAGDVSEVDPVKPVLGPGWTHGWLADGVPIDVFKSIPTAYENRERYPRRPADPLSVTVVLNDPEMADEHDDAAEFYREASAELSMDIAVEECLTTAELAETFETRHDLVHYIGHCEEAGLRCRDGHLSVSSLAESNAETFFLNACGSFYEGIDLVEKGSVAGAVTFDKVLDGHARRVGTAFIRLLVGGFSIEHALQLARRRIIMGKDYTVVGDGTHTLVSAEEVPMAATLERLDDGRFRIAFDVQTPGVVGETYHPPLPSADRPRLLGTEREATLTSSDLRDVLDRLDDIPVIYDGDIRWSSDLRDSLD